VRRIASPRLFPVCCPVLERDECRDRSGCLDLRRCGCLGLRVWLSQAEAETRCVENIVMEGISARYMMLVMIIHVMVMMWYRNRNYRRGVYDGDMMSSLGMWASFRTSGNGGGRRCGSRCVHGNGRRSGRAVEDMWRRWRDG
jgi:hypothetical protein